eukprot:CAMPEP_0203662278 /NCGR_PEP_ID=MMETSP0090-20130426/300_1 /ASSEMBLY_ACC=CAM_ASM_001088 /TAXON_ID=426623 /ORGANISM="Chaetoceros affinis, Strain CCMP159" /LENGTH=1073 /DNA_ID=CAMNT_0050525041 /DNA_START=61 /DNA_END=3282 /DNA_ORIENTATION=-
MTLSAEGSQLAALLVNLTQPDTEAIRNAEAMLKPILKNPNCVPALHEILSARDSQAVPVRHVAGILLRKRIPGHYAKLPVEYRTKLKADLLQFLAMEGERTVRNGAIGVTATICKQETPADNEEAAQAGAIPWPELFQFIAAATKESNPDARELAFLLLNEMTDTVGSYLAPQFQNLAELFQSSITGEQEVLKVKTASVKALGGLMAFLADQPDVDIFCNLVPALLQFSVDCQKRNDEETISIILDVFYDLAYSPSQTVAVNLPPIVKFCLGVMADSNLEMNVRDSAALVVATMSESRPKKFGKDTELLSLTLNSIFNLIETSDESGAGALFQSNPAWRDDDDEDFDPEADTATATSMAQGTLDMLAFVIPKKYIFQPVVEMCFNRFQSPNENHRKAGIACLGVIAEGCAEPFREHLAEIMPIVLQASGDASAAVRECACFTLGQMSEHCQPEVLSYSSQVLPISFALLDDTTVAVQATSCYVLEMFCERLEPDSVRPFLDPLVRKLAHMLEVTQKRSVQEMSIAALAATAVAAEDEFTPYVDGVAKLMAPLMAITDEKLFSLRGRALECMGYLSIAVGKESFRPYFTQSMQCACEGLALDSTDLHEFAYAAFANMAKAMESEFSPCLPELVPHLLHVLKQDDGCLEKQAEVQGAFDGLNDSDDEDEEGGNFVINVRTALLDAKKGAITAIGEIGAHCGVAFVPFLEETISLLQKAASNWHPLIKAETAESLPSLVVSIVAAKHGGSIDWEKGDIAGASPLGPETTTVASAVLKELVGLMKDGDKETVGKACAGVENVLTLCGPHALNLVGNECLEATHAIITKSAPCQLDENVDYDDEDDEHDSFMTSVCDLVAAFGRVMGPHFAQYLPTFLPPICEFAKSSRPPSDRGMAIGCLGELAQELGDGIKEYWTPVFLPAVLAGLADEDHNVKRNAAFCAGVCCEGLGESIAADYVQILQAIGQLFSIDVSISDTSAAAVDNASAGVCRMIMASPSSVPIAQVLPVVLKALPLKNDMTENETVYKCLLGLLQMNNADALVQKSEIKRVFIEATAPDSKVDDHLKAQLTTAIAAIN